MQPFPHTCMYILLYIAVLCCPLLQQQHSNFEDLNNGVCHVLKVVDRFYITLFSTFPMTKSHRGFFITRASSCPVKNGVLPASLAVSNSLTVPSISTHYLRSSVTNDALTTAVEHPVSHKTSTSRSPIAPLPTGSSAAASALRIPNNVHLPDPTWPSRGSAPSASISVPP